MSAKGGKLCPLCVTPAIHLRIRTLCQGNRGRSVYTIKKAGTDLLMSATDRTLQPMQPNVWHLNHL